MIQYALRTPNEENPPRPSTISAALWKLLTARGITTLQQANEYLYPTREQLRDPFEIAGMREAVAAIQSALDRKARFCVYGDYDVDGVSSSSILSSYLMSVGADVRVYLPSRHREGYGLNVNAIRDLVQTGVEFLITVDCGVTNVEEIRYAKSLGMECVVTDHHTPPEVLPDCPVVVPLVGHYKYGALCGGGVAFKLVCALGGLSCGLAYIDIAALATVADVVPLTGENRVIVTLGLERLNKAPRPGIKALREVAGIPEDKPLTVGHLGFQIAPRLNAGGRIDTADLSRSVLCACDLDEARELADKLNALNEERKKLEDAILNDAYARLEDFDFLENRIIILEGEDWNAGVIGLAASRLVERYHYPVILLSVNPDGTSTGSCRSIEGLDIYAALNAVSHLFVRFGGHKQAAGLTIMAHNIPKLIEELNEVLRKTVSPGVYVPLEEYDAEVDLNELDCDLVCQMERMQPCGFGNPTPVLRAKAYSGDAHTIGKDAKHLKLLLTQGDGDYEALWWQNGFRKDRIPSHCDVLFSPGLNSYRGQVRVQMELKALRYADVYEELRAKRDVEILLIHDYLTSLNYNRKINFSNVSEDELLERLTAEPQGTLILCEDPDAARGVFEAFERRGGANAPDFLCGEEAPERFNAVWLYPQGEIPKGYRTIVHCGRRISERVPLPNREALRTLFKAVRRLRGQILAGKGRVLSAVQRESGLDPAICAVGLAVLIRTGYASYVRGVGAVVVGIELCEGAKGDPLQSEFYTRLCEV